jgi:hypothetical protein
MVLSAKPKLLPRPKAMLLVVGEDWVEETLVGSEREPVEEV